MRIKDVIPMLPDTFQTKLNDFNNITIDELCEFYIEFRNYCKGQVDKTQKLLKQLEEFRQRKEYTLDELEYFKKLQDKVQDQKIFTDTLNELFKNVSIRIADRFPNISPEFIVNTGKYKIYITTVNWYDCETNAVDTIERVEGGEQ